MQLKYIKRYYFLLFAFCFSIIAVAQDNNLHKQSSTYQWPDDPAVVANLKKWQDLKFGILMHWGVYSVPGICESWTITSEDWITPDTTRTYEEYKQWYWGLNKLFNPTKFNPEQWAKVAKDAGMKYFVFTSKHHDGFCLWNTKTTDYNVTNSGFKGNAKSDVLGYVFDAFRNQGMLAGCYFSKPDWHCPYYWWPSKSAYNRQHNYSIAQYPERWQKYKDFVYDQVSELMNNYGHMDILWLDGGWCTAPREDIDLDRIVNMSRKAQPGLIVVERACPGKFENYQTPEQTIPAAQINNPWETCMTLTNDWGWVPKPTFKSADRIIAVLSEVVAKGGSLLLGVGPTPEGLIEDESVTRLEKIGAWLNKNGEAIYSTVTTPVYTNADNSVWFTANKDGKTLYAIVPFVDNQGVPESVTWEENTPKKGSRIVNLATGKTVKYTVKDGKTTVVLPKSEGAVALKMTTK